MLKADAHLILQCDCEGLVVMLEEDFELFCLLWRTIAEAHETTLGCSLQASTCTCRTFTLTVAAELLQLAAVQTGVCC